MQFFQAPSILAETVFIKTEEIENKPDVALYSPDGSGTPDEQRPTDICQEYIDTNSEQLTPKGKIHRQKGKVLLRLGKLDYS